jgi:S-adenosylmethionine-diacylglycerol 3-amino-3-carboxypropyl transferase
MAESSIAARARFDHVRYAQVWEDADVLVRALKPRPGARLVSIASAGDNALALLTTDPAHVAVLDLSPAQLACVRLRIAAYRRLTHGELLALIGSRPSTNRGQLLDRLLADVPDDQSFWSDQRERLITYGLGGIGKFEHYFRLFATRVLPLVQPRARVRALLTPRPAVERAAFYDRWNSWRWRLLVRLFFSRTVMGRLGRDPAFFDYAHGDLGAHLAARTRHALVTLDPADNPYLHWMLMGQHGTALPLALRPEAFPVIRDRLDRLSLHCQPLEAFALETAPVDGWNLSDIFEYMDPAAHLASYRAILAATAPGGRLVYWNMIAERRVPAALDDQILAHDAVGAALLAEDKAFFYSALRIDERRS